MKRLLTLLASLILWTVPLAALAQSPETETTFDYVQIRKNLTVLGTINGQTAPGAQGSQGGTLPAPGANNNVLTSNGSTWASAAPSGGGGGGPFLPAQLATISAFSSAASICVDAQTQYVYVLGILASNSHTAVAQIKIADGTVKTLDSKMER